MHRWDDFASDDFDEPEDDMMDFDDFGDDDEDDMPTGKGVSSEWNDFDDFDEDDDMPSAKMVSASFIDIASTVEEASDELGDYVLADVHLDDDDEDDMPTGKGVSSEWNDFDEDDDTGYVGPKAKSGDLSDYQLARVHGGY